jgi:C4-dicarboxylate transporter DctM subunit
MCGTSVAIAAMVGAFAFTNLKKYGYSLPLSLGIVAAGGALGILIPPSVPMIVYSAFSEESTGKLFLAGVIPGIITVILFCLYVGWAYRKQGGNKVAKPASWSERWQSLKNGIWALLIPVGIMIPLYAGWATPTETAALGTLWALIVGIFIYRTISWKDVIPLLKEGLSSSTMIMIIICGAMVLGNAVTQIGLSQAMANLFANNLSPLMFIASTILIMLFMGCFLEGASIMMICLPIFITTLRVYNLNLIWYAVIMVMSIEIGLLTPPVGLNIYAIDGVAKQLGLPSTLGIAVKGSYMFMLLYFISMILVVLMPQLALWIPLGM